MAFNWAAFAQGAGAASSGISGPILSAVMSRKENREARQFALDRYNQELQDNEKRWRMENEYNEHVWHMMNDYNSPTAQMSRFKEAGLNPALIYGQSNGSGPISTSSIGRPGTPRWNPNSYNIDLSGGLSMYNAFRESAARVNNLAAQNDVLKAEAAKKAVESVGLTWSSKMGELDYGLKSQLRQNSVDAANASLDKLKTETRVMMDKNTREAAQSSMSLREAAERILNMRGERMNKELDSQLKRLDIQLRNEGIHPNSPWWLKILRDWKEDAKSRVINDGGEFVN